MLFLSPSDTVGDFSSFHTFDNGKDPFHQPTVKKYCERCKQKLLRPKLFWSAAPSHSLTAHHLHTHLWPLCSRYFRLSSLRRFVVGKPELWDQEVLESEICRYSNWKAMRLSSGEPRGTRLMIGLLVFFPYVFPPNKERGSCVYAVLVVVDR